MSFALVLWVNTQQTSVVPIVAVGDKRMHTDPERVGKVRWMPADTRKKEPKDGWSIHDARVLHICDNQKDLQAAEKNFWEVRDAAEPEHLEGTQNDPVRNKDKKKPSKKKEILARLHAERSILAQAADKSSATTAPRCTGCEQAHVTIRHLKRERDTATVQLEQLKASMKKICCDIQGAIAVNIPAPPAVAVPLSSAAVLQATCDGPTTPSAAAATQPEACFSSPTHDQPGMVDIGEGVMVPRTKLMLIRSDRPTVMTRHLMDLVFTRDEMATCSVTGRVNKKNLNKVSKPALDQGKVSALLAYVRGKFPAAETRLLKASMAEKLQDMTPRLSAPFGSAQPT